MDIVRDLNELRSLTNSHRLNAKRIGFVPTMGALHEGHLSLLDIAKSESDIVIASIFVNPTQFAAHEDLGSYPRQEEQDLAALRARGCDVAYLPDQATMYPDGEETRVSVPELGAKLEGQFRPHFFGGVATVVTKLFNQVQPDIAIFGEKDFQQVQIIRRMVADLSLPVTIIAGETRREIDGLAQSSRNAYLSEKDRSIVPILNQAMHRAAKRIRSGTAITTCLEEAQETILRAGIDRVDYIEACNADTLDPLTEHQTDYQARLLAAAWIGKTRLIDNIEI